MGYNIAMPFFQFFSLCIFNEFFSLKKIIFTFEKQYFIFQTYLKKLFENQALLCCCEFVTDSNAIYFIAVCYVMNEACKVEVCPF